MKRLADQTLYEILEVREDAPLAEIAAACDRAREIYGPGALATYSLMTPDEAALIARRIDEARVTLLDPEARTRYDEALRRPGEEHEGSAAPPGGTGIPVIPAAQPSPPPAPAASQAERSAIQLAPAMEVARASALPQPIQLKREVGGAPREGAAPPVDAAPPAAPPPPVPVIADGMWTGDALRQVREARGLTIQQIADRTKVTRHHIENIEGERFGALPAPVYLRGILLSMARELRLDGQKVARAYLERAAAALAGKLP